MEKIPVNERFSSKRLVADLMEKGIDARYFPNTDLLLEALTNEARTGDVILIMSNGAFDNLHQRLLQNF
jgi:UDP-N-acetylmuramate: L-alanyl-gamma-D-glutamyl-meso-diaminopimelate ligase